MTWLTATLHLYRAVWQETWDSLTRSWLAIPSLALIAATMILASLLLAGSGFLGGILQGLLQAALVGTYLSLVRIAVRQRRRLRVEDLRENLGNGLWEVMSVSFLFWIASLILQTTAPALAFPVLMVAWVIFNAAPELLVHERGQGTELLSEAAQFLQVNWPEWIPPFLLGSALTAWALSPLDAPGISALLLAASSFGPSFGFTGLGTHLFLQVVNPWLILPQAALLLGVTHTFMLFRAQLYRRLNASSRRSRTWDQRR